MINKPAKIFLITYKRTYQISKPGSQFHTELHMAKGCFKCLHIQFSVCGALESTIH